MNFTDVKTALAEMGRNIGTALVKIVVAGVAVVIGVGIVMLLGYVLTHYALQFFTAVALGLLATWFLIELQNARTTREYEEQLEAYKRAKAQTVAQRK